MKNFRIIFSHLLKKAAIGSPDDYAKAVGEQSDLLKSLKERKEHSKAINEQSTLPKGIQDHREESDDIDSLATDPKIKGLVKKLLDVLPQTYEELENLSWVFDRYRGIHCRIGNGKFVSQIAVKSALDSLLDIRNYGVFYLKFPSEDSLMDFHDMLTEGLGSRELFRRDGDEWQCHGAIYAAKKSGPEFLSIRKAFFDSAEKFRKLYEELG